VTPLTTDEVLDELRAMYRRRGRDDAIELDGDLAALGFRSLDFSELVLRLEDRLGRELNFSAAALRRVETVRDVVDFVRTSAES
jgi:acyl carrier protein